ncbi:hypothetical protein ES708_06635 [subsurface metagenome]
MSKLLWFKDLGGIENNDIIVKYSRKFRGDRCNKRLHLQVCKGLHLVARRFTVIADFRVNKSQPLPVKIFC